MSISNNEEFSPDFDDAYIFLNLPFYHMMQKVWRDVQTYISHSHFDNYY